MSVKACAFYSTCKETASLKVSPNMFYKTFMSFYNCYEVRDDTTVTTVLKEVLYSLKLYPSEIMRKWKIYQMNNTNIFLHDLTKFFLSLSADFVISVTYPTAFA